MKKIVVLIVAVIFLAGCAELSDKLIRKPKAERKSRGFVAVKTYDVKPSMELYTKRYIFWKNWHRELLVVLMDSNKKKKIVAIQQDISNLIDMQRMLVDPKAEQLQPYIDEMNEIETVIKKVAITKGNEVRIRRRLETIGTRVKRDFSYTKVNGLIRPEFSAPPSFYQDDV